MAITFSRMRKRLGREHREGLIEGVGSLERRRLQ